MSFQFRFPIALLNYLKEDNSKLGFQTAMEKAREWAKPIADEKRARPTLKDAEDYLNEIVRRDQEEKSDRTAQRA